MQQPTRICSAATRVLRRGTSRALDLAALARILADEERVCISVGELAESLRNDERLVLLERPDPIGGLPLVVHETGPAYQDALSSATGGWAVIDVGERPYADAPDTFEVLAAPLLEMWKDAAGDPELRSEVSSALGGLYEMVTDAGWERSVEKG